MFSLITAFLISFMQVQEPVEAELDTPVFKPSIVYVDSLKGKYLEIASIIIVGNKKTKDRIITREMDVKVGKKIYYEDLVELLEWDENRIFNTRLFNSVDSKIFPRSGGKADIIIQVKERWYTWPSPQFSLADGNFSEWWNVRGGDLSRINYGLLLDKQNIRGLNEKLSVLAQFGFTRRFSLKYSMPYLNKAQTWGMNMVLTYRENAQVDYIAQNNNLVNIKVRDLQEMTDFQGRTLQNWYEAELGFTYRPSFFNTHLFGVRYRQHQIADTMQFLNPYYFVNGELEQRYFKLEYLFTRDKRDRANYPLKGHYIVAQLEQYGLGIFNDVNFTTATVYAAKYMKVRDGLYFSTGAFGYLSTIDGQPFSLYQSISGQNYQLIKGYENYRIQGNAFGIHKNELRQRLFDTKLNIGQFIPFVPADQFGTVPFAAYLKLGFDHGYVQNKFPGYFNEELGYIGNERLTNRYLYGYSIGLDIVSFYDLVIRLEYTITREGERELFPHFRNSM